MNVRLKTQTVRPDQIELIEAISNFDREHAGHARTLKDHKDITVECFEIIDDDLDDKIFQMVYVKQYEPVWWILQVTVPWICRDEKKVSAMLRHWYEYSIEPRLGRVKTLVIISNDSLVTRSIADMDKRICRMAWETHRVQEIIIFCPKIVLSKCSSVKIRVDPQQRAVFTGKNQITPLNEKPTAVKNGWEKFVMFAIDPTVTKK